MNTNIEQTNAEQNLSLQATAELPKEEVDEEIVATPFAPGMGGLAWMANEASLAARATELSGIKSKTKTSRKRVVKQTESTLDKIKAYVETGAEFTLVSIAEKFEIKESTAGVFISTLKSKNGAHAMPITIDKKTKTYKFVAPVIEAAAVQVEAEAEAEAAE